MGAGHQTTQAPDSCVGDVIRLARHAGARNWIPATSGNFSVRIDAASCAITATGGDKAALTASGVIRAELSGPKHPRASAEAPLHYMLYRLLPEAAAVAHVHAQSSVLASLQLCNDGQVGLRDLEMLKAFRGFQTHASTLNVPVFDNDQDMDELAMRVEKSISGSSLQWGFLLAGHGLYAWGTSTEETLRHLDAFDYLFSLSLKMKGIPA